MRELRNEHVDEKFFSVSRRRISAKFRAEHGQSNESKSERRFSKTKDEANTKELSIMRRNSAHTMFGDISDNKRSILKAILLIHSAKSIGKNQQVRYSLAAKLQAASEECFTFRTVCSIRRLQPSLIPFVTTRQVINPPRA